MANSMEDDSQLVSLTNKLPYCVRRQATTVSSKPSEYFLDSFSQTTSSCRTPVEQLMIVC